ncbi:uncharacterized protein LOC142178403 [Nicotiana tabacum]|uniref:Uncharacterized protein LOC142178403 n=1 Tax=Nicotiana tabacum TaxID=4097 RepID=A0AC58U2Z1_TOBAC
MWTTTINCIREAARDVLGVLKCYSGGLKGDWWWNEEVQGKVKAKKAAYLKLVGNTNEEEQRTCRERYKKARKEAKLAVTSANTAAFERLYEDLGAKEATGSCTGSQRDFGFCRRIRSEEVEGAMRKMGRGKATGSDDIPDCNNYRGIKLLSHTMKIWERVVERRVRHSVTISENQFEFIPERSTMETIHLVRRLMEQYRERKKNLHMTRDRVNAGLEVWRQTLESKVFKLISSKTEYLEYKFSDGMHGEGERVKIGTQVIPKRYSFGYLGSIIQGKEEIDEDVTHHIGVGCMR